MATSSIIENIRVNNPKVLEEYVDAMEERAKNCHPRTEDEKSNVVYLDAQIGRIPHRLSAVLCGTIVNICFRYLIVPVYSKIPFDMLTKEDRVRTCYMQACLWNVMGDCLTNAKARSVFGLSEAEKTKASRIIHDTLAAKMIKPVDPDTAPRYMRYQPFWA